MRDLVVVRGLGKQFSRYHADRPWTLQEAFQRGLRGIGPAERFWALRDVSFSVAPGRMLGVVGPNGAGKSTLLRLISGVGRPDEGSVEVGGRIGALMDVGAGFHSDLTGRENVLISAVVNGLTRREAERRFDSIVAFAELEDFIDSPLRTYSTGMQMRLGFAVAVHTESEILVIDEVLAVGDASFRQKCLKRIELFKKQGHTMIFVSHQPDSIREFCDDALWMQSGRLMAHGGVDAVLGAYLAAVGGQDAPAAAARLSVAR